MPDDGLSFMICAGTHVADTMASTSPTLATSKQMITSLLTEHFRYTPLVSPALRDYRNCVRVNQN